MVIFRENESTSEKGGGTVHGYQAARVPLSFGLKMGRHSIDVKSFYNT